MENADHDDHVVQVDEQHEVGEPLHQRPTCISGNGWEGLRSLPDERAIQLVDEFEAQVCASRLVSLPRFPHVFGGRGIDDHAFHLR
jgi:hypothetical protein